MHCGHVLYLLSDLQLILLVFSFIYFQNKDYYKQAYGTLTRSTAVKISVATSSSFLVPEFMVLSYFKS